MAGAAAAAARGWGGGLWQAAVAQPLRQLEEGAAAAVGTQAPALQCWTLMAPPLLGSAQEPTEAGGIHSQEQRASGEQQEPWQCKSERKHGRSPRQGTRWAAVCHSVGKVHFRVQFLILTTGLCGGCTVGIFHSVLHP